MRGLSIHLFLRRNWGSPCWSWITRMVSKIPQMFILSISNCEWHCSVKSASESENVNPCLDFLGIPDRRTAYVKRQLRLWWTQVDQVSPPTWSPWTNEISATYMWLFCKRAHWEFAYELYPRQFEPNICDEAGKIKLLKRLSEVIRQKSVTERSHLLA